MHPSTFKIHMMANAPHISDIEGILRLLQPHVPSAEISYVPEETYATGWIPGGLQIHVLTFTYSGGAIFARVTAGVSDGIIRDIEISRT
jgi:hypothetical protein